MTKWITQFVPLWEISLHKHTLISACMKAVNKAALHELPGKRMILKPVFAIIYPGFFAGASSALARVDLTTVLFSGTLTLMIFGWPI